jgi:ribosomal-protein-alanine N-acetyltransferase
VLADRPMTSIPIFLAGQRCSLRPLSPADVDGPYLGWFNDAEVSRFNSHHVFPYTREEALAWVAALPERRDMLVLAIEVEGRHVGNVSLQGIDAVSRCADLAIVVGERDVWGRGIGAEAAALLVAHGFRALNLNRISCGVVGASAAARRWAERLGMTQEGVRRQALWTDGAYQDLIEYGLLASEWASR